MIEMSETELLQAFRKERSEEAFAELVRRYAGLVYSVARRRLSNAALAEDITQLVFIRFAKTPPKVQSAGELAAWLHRTTLNVTIDTWRSESRRRNREQQAAVMQPETNTATTHAFWDEISPSLDEAIDQLNDEDRQAILLRFFKAKPMRDVGAVLGVSEAAAKMRVGRAVDKLRTQLGASAAATTTVVLAGVLAERSAEAAPVQLVSRLAGMKLPSAGAVGKGVLLHALSRISKAKVAAGAAGLALVVISVLHLSRPVAPVAQAAIQASNDVAAAPASAAQRASETAQADLMAAASAKAVKTQFHVLDAETGAGLAQTKIKSAYFGAGGQGEGHDTVTDDKGDASLTGPDDPSKSSCPNVFVTAEGHVPAVVCFRTTPPDDYTIKLEPAATATGVVVDEQGLPVSGAKMVIQNPPYGQLPMESIDFQTCPITNQQDGTWSCSYIPKNTNEIRLVLNKPGYAASDITIPVDKMGLNNLTLVIDRGFTIAGKITDKQGDPVINAEVKVLDGDRSKRKSTRSDENGAFVLAGVCGDSTSNLFRVTSLVQTNERGSVVLHGQSIQGPLKADLAVQAEGFAPQTNTVALSAVTNAADFTLAPGSIFRGRVVDEAGNPISNAVVQTDYDFDHQIDKSFDWTARTDASGWFQWNSAPAQEICYWFEADGYEPVRGLKLAADGSEHRIVLKSSNSKR
jgi:RNA polymerase sigma factor (sigma-70 family)